MYIFISIIVLPRIRGNIRLRKNKISNDLERATNLKNQLEELVNNYELKIEEAKEKSNTILKSSLKKNTLEFANNLREVRNQIDKKMQIAISIIT